MTVPRRRALAELGDFVTACYIVAFSLFIFGVRQGTHPTTARRGNLIAAAGMAIAVAITLSLDVIGNGVLILIGILIGTLVGAVASRRVQMTQMPQMVALYNGVGGGAAALIAWAEFRHQLALGGDIPLDVLIPILFSTGGRLGLVLGLEHRLRQAPGADLRAADPLPGPAHHQRHPARRDPGRMRRAGRRPRLGPLAGRCSSPS